MFILPEVQRVLELREQYIQAELKLLDSIAAGFPTVSHGEAEIWCQLGVSDGELTAKVLGALQKARKFEETLGATDEDVQAAILTIARFYTQQGQPDIGNFFAELRRSLSVAIASATRNTQQETY